MSDNNFTRYSDVDLEEFKELILIKLEKSRLDLQTLTESFSNTGNNDTMDTSPTFKILEEDTLLCLKKKTVVWLHVCTNIFKI